LLPVEEEECSKEEGGLIKDLKRHGRLAVAWDQHGSPVPRWTLTRYGLDNTPAWRRRRRSRRSRRSSLIKGLKRYARRRSSLVITRMN